MASARRTNGVIQPPQTLLRGNLALSRMATRSPELRSRQAQDEPAGPPPTIRTSQESIPDPVHFVHWIFVADDCGSRAARRRRVRQTPPGTTAECRREMQPPNRQDTSA